MPLKREFVKLVSKTLKPLGYKAIKEKDSLDFYLHEYSSYEEYRDVQIHFNKQKIDQIWADKKTLKRVGEILLKEYADRSVIQGLCHGTRNGFEQNYLREISERSQRRSRQPELIFQKRQMIMKTRFSGTSMTSMRAGLGRKISSTRIPSTSLGSPKLLSKHGYHS